MVNSTHQLGALLGLAVIGFLSTIVVFVSPGWAIFKYPVTGYENNSNKKESLKGIEEATAVKSKEPFVSLTTGLWYFQTCFHINGEWWGKDIPCYRSLYQDAAKRASSIPDEHYPLRMIFENVGIALHLGLLEFQIEASIGVVTAIVGAVVLAIYKHGSGKRRVAGLLSCVCLITTGVIYLVAVGKVVRSIVQANVLFQTKSWITQHAPVPWCLIVSVIGATFDLVAAFGVMIFMSKYRKEVTINEYVVTSHQVMGSCPFHTVSPPGYDPNNLVPVTYKNDLSERIQIKCEPLPPKV